MQNLLSAPLWAATVFAITTCVKAYSSTFDLLGSRNVVVYYGSAVNTNNPSLMDLCNDNDIDMIIMGFVRSYTGPNGQPTFGIGQTCKTPNPLPANYPGVSCPTLAQNITACQRAGKKVMLSLGGGSSSVNVNSTDAAERVANMLWNVFGAGTAPSNTIRPFGDVVLDGFDFDYESGSNGTFTDVLSGTLQRLYKSTTPARYISVSSACANTSSLPLGFYQNANFVWPRFYNSNACKAGGKGYNASVDNWISFLRNVSSNLGTTYPRFYIGALGFNNNNAGGGWVAPDNFSSLVTATRQRVGDTLFGGVSFWQGTDGQLSMTADGSRDILTVAKDTLGRPAAATGTNGTLANGSASSLCKRGSPVHWMGQTVGYLRGSS